MEYVVHVYVVYMHAFTTTVVFNGLKSHYFSVFGLDETFSIHY